MPATLVKDVLWRAGVILNDVLPQFVRWPEQELVSWLNDGQMAIVNYLPTACTRRDAIRLLPGSRQSIASIASTHIRPGDGSTAAAVNGTVLLDIPCNMGPDGFTRGAPIRPIPRDVMDASFPGWHTHTASAVSGFITDPRAPKFFYVYPAVPSNVTVWVEADYAAEPALIPNTGEPGSELYAFGGTSTTKISIDDRFVDDLVNYICARAFAKSAKHGDTGKSAFYADLFAKSLAAKADAVANSNPNINRLQPV